jgi:hypothetical protein
MTQIAEPVHNGVDTSALFATLDAIEQQPDPARFQFRAGNVWLGGAHNRGTIAVRSISPSAPLEQARSRWTYQPVGGSWYGGSDGGRDRPHRLISDPNGYRKPIAR